MESARRQPSEPCCGSMFWPRLSIDYPALLARRVYASPDDCVSTVIARSNDCVSTVIARSNDCVSTVIAGSLHATAAGMPQVS